MKNCITPGSELLRVNSRHDKSTEDIIVNEDWAMVGVVLEYNAEIGKITAKKAWDTSQNPYRFYIWAYREDGVIPSADDILVNSHIVFHRCGEGNNNFLIAPTRLECEGEAQGTAASFISFFFLTAIELPGVPALVAGVLSEPIQIDGVVQTFRRLGVDEYWYDTGLHRLLSFEVTDTGVVIIGAIDIVRVLACNTDIINKVYDCYEDCETEAEEECYCLSLIPGYVGNEFCYFYTGTSEIITIGAVCCG